MYLIELLSYNICYYNIYIYIHIICYYIIPYNSYILYSLCLYMTYFIIISYVDNWMAGDLLQHAPTKQRRTKPRKPRKPRCERAELFRPQSSSRSVVHKCHLVLVTNMRTMVLEYESQHLPHFYEPVL